MSQFAALAAILTEGQRHRAWSLLVTVFGDLARAPGQELGSAPLGRIGTEMGLRPEAVRVALHRLRKEGWLAYRRQGRHTFYRLTDDGRAQSEAAGPRIYGAPGGARAYLIVAQGDAPGVCVAPGLTVAAEASLAPHHLSAELVAAPPDWLAAQLCPAGTGALARATRERFEALLPDLRAAPPLDPLQVATLRVLTVHDWRRLALRLPDLPDFVLPGGDDIRAARTASAAILGRLPRPPVDAL